MTGPSRKVICDVCSKDLCASSLRGHMQKIHKVGMMATTTSVEKTTNTTPVVERVEEVEGKGWMCNLCSRRRKEIKS